MYAYFADINIIIANGSISNQGILVSASNLKDAKSFIYTKYSDVKIISIQKL